MFLYFVSYFNKKKEDKEDTLKIIIAMCKECACPCIGFSRTDK